MEDGYFLKQHFSYTAMPTWQTLSSAMEIQDSQLISSTGLSRECFLGPDFDSALSSMVSSPVSNSNNVSNDSFIGKLGSIGNSAAYPSASASNSTNTSCYNTPLNSPPKLSFPIMDKTVKDKFPNSMPLNSCLADFSADPGFAKRAAKFSCFGSRSFNGRINQLEINNAELPYRSNGTLSRISSSPSIKAVEAQLQDSSQEESALSEQKPKYSNGSTSRKRKAASRGKAVSVPMTPAAKVVRSNEDPSAKRSKPNEGDKSENLVAGVQEEQKGNSCTEDDEKPNMTNQKPPEAPKDYIHVRARRGQATDSHSLAERVRREKISERMKLLQDLVPGCNKVTGKAVMLDEIINYVQSLQRQVEFLSMKLSSINTKLDINVDTSASKYTYPSSTSLPNQMFSLDSSAFFGHQPEQNPALTGNVCNDGKATRDPVDHLDSTSLFQTLGMQLPPLNGLNECFQQYPNFCEDDLQAIVQMGFGTKPNFQLQDFQGSDGASQTRVDL